MSAKASYDDLNTPLIAIVGFVSAIVTFALVVGFQAGYYYVESAVEASRAQSVGPTRSETILAEQRGKLASYGWVNRDQKEVAIPISDAMAMVLREQSEHSDAH